MRIKLFNILLIIGLSVLLAGAAFFGHKVHTLAKQQQAIRQDYALANSITFGLFSVDQWRDRLSAVVNDQINGYSITPEQKQQIQAAVEKALHKLVAKTVASIDKPQKSIGGKLKKIAFHALVDSNSLQAQVRPFAKTIVQKISSPRSQARLKDIASSKLNQLENQTYDATSEANDKVTKYVYKKYNVTDQATLNKTIHNRLQVIWEQTINNALFMLACVLAALVLWWILRKKVQLQTVLFVMALLFAGVLLAVGLTSPVIEVDARIQSLDFMMLGEKVTFDNQILFFQSKSIWGIITSLLNQNKPDAVTVGIIILLFVLILPVVRLIAKGLHLLFIKTLGNNKVLNYLAFESGKWDMADVMIVGMLMTYIGLNGILKSQLTNLNIHNDTLTTSTVNYTSLQPGFVIFAGYVVFELALSYILKCITPEREIAHPRKRKVQ